MMHLCSLAAAMSLALGSPAPRPAPAHSASAFVPNWAQATALGQAGLKQVFAIDGLDVALISLAAAAALPDGTAPDAGARLVEVEFWAHNPQNESADFFERFYAYAELNDGSNTDGEGVSFYPMESNSELGAVTLKANDTMHARFYIEVPAGSQITSVVVFGPVDGAKTVLRARA